MNVLVIGLGSMGKRRVRLIRQIDENIRIFGVDSREDRRKEAEELYNVTTFADLDKAFKENLDAALICTSPLSHAGLIAKWCGNFLVSI